MFAELLEIKEASVFVNLCVADVAPQSALCMNKSFGIHVVLNLIPNLLKSSYLVYALVVAITELVPQDPSAFCFIIPGKMMKP